MIARELEAEKRVGGLVMFECSCSTSGGLTCVKGGRVDMSAAGSTNWRPLTGPLNHRELENGEGKERRGNWLRQVLAMGGEKVTWKLSQFLIAHA